ncbi:hypothetical protein C8Q77DRAFT_1153322 [Trametes polyzona]|nr:hypothetical protein C8Q77DRAFT_1153322 [Trametes polyzona]
MDQILSSTGFVMINDLLPCHTEGWNTPQPNLAHNGPACIDASLGTNGLWDPLYHLDSPANQANNNWGVEWGAPAGSWDDDKENNSPNNSTPGPSPCTKEAAQTLADMASSSTPSLTFTDDTVVTPLNTPIWLCRSKSTPYIPRTPSPRTLTSPPWNLLPTPVFARPCNSLPNASLPNHELGPAPKDVVIPPPPPTGLFFSYLHS